MVGDDGSGNDRDPSRRQEKDSLLDGAHDDDPEETSNAFSPSVKQFSAPRQVNDLDKASRDAHILTRFRLQKKRTKICCSTKVANLSNY